MAPLTPPVSEIDAISLDNASDSTTDNELPKAIFLDRVPQRKATKMPMEGCFVELAGSARKYSDEICCATQHCVNVDGQRGACRGWQPGDVQYIVETFGGEIVCVDEEQCTFFEPPSPEQPGGFDMAWPQGALEQAAFATKMGSTLLKKDHCVIQMFGGTGMCEEAASLAKDHYEFSTLPADLEPDYLGCQCNSQVAWIRPPPLKRGLRSIAQQEAAAAGGLVFQDYTEISPFMSLRGLDALSRCDTAMTNIGALLFPVTLQFPEGLQRFRTWGRTNALLRISATNKEDRVALRKSLQVATDEEVGRHAEFVDSRRLCMLYLVHGDGGELTLHKDGGDVVIPVSANKVVLFRHDLMDYSFEPKGESLAMQAWLIDAPPRVHDQQEDMRYITGPAEPPGNRVCVMGCHTRFAGNSTGFDRYWNMLAFGTDCLQEVPICRWDLDVYYRAEHTVGFSMTKHGGFLAQDDVELFDNQFFKISSEDAKGMSPGQRIALEVGYSCLHNAGHRAEDMKGWCCGVFCGDSGADFDWELRHRAPTPQTSMVRSNAITCSRLAHTFGMVGPTHTSDTACSSSLVAMGLAHMSMRLPVGGQPQTSISTCLEEALVMGIQISVGPANYIGLSGPGMLSPKGRCFTFDYSADGYARGEGCGSVKLKKCSTKGETAGRLAILVGSNVNQDGRSASMTAPHGPSQQDVIRASMREGGLDPRSITIAECHGTGTSLGDPIEVGALRGVMKDSRVAPFPKTSTKTCLGHMEACAGMGGFIKCLAMLQRCVGTPNNHLVKLNPHLDITGYPVAFETELLDFSQNSGLTGVSSFGFGGTNARADVWGNAQQGHHKSIAGAMLRESRIII